MPQVECRHSRNEPLELFGARLVVEFVAGQLIGQSNLVAPIRSGKLADVYLMGEQEEADIEIERERK